MRLERHIAAVLGYSPEVDCKLLLLNHALQKQSLEISPAATDLNAPSLSTSFHGTEGVTQASKGGRQPTVLASSGADEPQ